MGEHPLKYTDLELSTVYTLKNGITFAERGEYLMHGQPITESLFICLIFV